MTIFDLLLLMVFTCSSTRCCPVRSFLSDGRTSEVSSVDEGTIAERIGSAAIAASVLLLAPSVKPDLRSSNNTDTYTAA